MAPAAGWLLAFFVAPLVIILIVSLATRGPYGIVIYGVSLDNYARALDPVYLAAYWRTFWIASATTAICVVLSYPIACFIALRAPRRWKAILVLLVVIPFWTSFLIRTYCWMLLLRTEGAINLALLKIGVISEPLSMLYTDFAVLLGQVYGELPFMILPLYVVLERLDKRVFEAAADLGANRAKTFVRVTVPLSFPGLVVGVVLVFIPSLGAFITPDILGGARSVMVGNLIQNQFIQLNQPFGSALSMVLTVVITVFLLIALRAGLSRNPA